MSVLSTEVPADTTWDFDQMTRLVAHVESLSPSEHQEISSILMTHSVHVSKNNNGEFVNLTSVPEFVLNDIANFVSYCTANKQHIDEYNNRLEEFKLRGTISLPESPVSPLLLTTNQDISTSDDHIDKLTPPSKTKTKAKSKAKSKTMNTIIEDVVTNDDHIQSSHHHQMYRHTDINNNIGGSKLPSTATQSRPNTQFSCARRRLLRHKSNVGTMVVPTTGTFHEMDSDKFRNTAAFEDGVFFCG